MHPLLFVSTTLRKIRFAGVIKKKKKKNFDKRTLFKDFTNVIEKQRLVIHTISHSLPTNLKMRNRKRKKANKVWAVSPVFLQSRNLLDKEEAIRALCLQNS